MHRGVRAIVVMALLCGCDIDNRRIWASVLGNAPFIYLAGLGVLHMLYEPWARADPRLKFGSRVHWATLAGLVALAIWASPHARFDGIGAYWLFFGSTTAALWLLLWRIAMTWPKSQPFRWTGTVAFALSVSPAVAGLASESLREYGELGISIWMLGSGIGLTFVAMVAPLAYEAWRIGQRHPAPAPARPDEGAGQGDSDMS